MSDTTNIYEESPDLDTIGGRLSRAREASGLSIKQLAMRLGVKTATVQAWESDRSHPCSHRQTMLSGLLGVSHSWILYGVGIAPAEEMEASQKAGLLNAQLDRLVLLHAETGQLINRLQSDMERLNGAR